MLRLVILILSMLIFSNMYFFFFKLDSVEGKYINILTIIVGLFIYYVYLYRRG